MTVPKLHIARERERKAITGISRASWWRYEKAGQAPSRIKLGPKAVGWFRHELDAWLRERAGREVAQ